MIVKAVQITTAVKIELTVTEAERFRNFIKNVKVVPEEWEPGWSPQDMSDGEEILALLNTGLGEIEL